MKLANPIYLWSLLGLLVPIAIHLLSRKEGKVIKLGSIRHVQETSTQQFKGIRLNEWVLLLLRCALIIVLSLILSGLYIDRKNGKWLVVEDGTQKSERVRVMIDSLEKQGYETHWLSNSFRSFKSSPGSSQLNYWSAIRQLGKQNLEEAVVFSFARMGKFKGNQYALPPHIKIIPVETHEKEFLLEAVQEKDSVNLRMGVTNPSSTYFYNRRVKFASDTIKVKQPQQIKIMLIADAARIREKKILKAAVLAIDQVTSSSLVVTEKKPAEISDSDSADWYFWMTDEKLPKTSASVLQWNPASFDQLIEEIEVKRWILTQPLTEETALNENLMISLGSLLTTDSSLQKISAQHDQRALPELMAWPSIKSNEAAIFTHSPGLPSFLFILFVLLLSVERYLSYLKNQ